jgi:signal transduction histidine kinase
MLWSGRGGSVIIVGESGVSQPPGRSRRGPATLVDAALAGAIAAGTFAAAVLDASGTGYRPVTWIDALISVVVFGLVLVRRRWPLPVLAASTVFAVGVAAGTDLHPVYVGATVVAAYTVATRTTRGTAWVASAVSAAIVYAAALVWSGEGWWGVPLGAVAWIGMATAVGDALRSRRAYVAAVEERARRAEQSRDEEARRRVTEERVRIARELHDVVAHHIAVINVQAGLAEHALRDRPEQAETALTHVRQAARTVLAELATILAVLRQPGDADAPTDPVRGLSQLDELLGSLASAGLRVTHHPEGSARPLPPAVDWAAYRIVQEALTNAYKHGADGTAELRIAYTPDAVVIDVDNPVASSRERADAAGHGLTGMRERASAVGGTLTAGPDGTGRFHVHAVLPTGGRAEGGLA